MNKHLPISETGTIRKFDSLADAQLNIPESNKLHEFRITTDSKSNIATRHSFERSLGLGKLERLYKSETGAYGNSASTAEFVSELGSVDKTGSILCSEGTSSRKDSLLARRMYDPKRSSVLKSKEFSQIVGTDVPLTALTYKMTEIQRQSYYTVPDFEDLIPTVEGIGAYCDKMQQMGIVAHGPELESFFVNVSSKIDVKTSEVALQYIESKTRFLAMGDTYNMFEEGQYRHNNVNLIAEKLQVMKTKFDKGTMALAFTGTSDGDMGGLLNLKAVSINTATITKPLFKMTTDEFLVAIAKIAIDYYRNSNKTVQADTFLISVSERMMLASTTVNVAGYVNKTRLELLEEALVQATQNTNFKVASAEYCAKDSNDNIPNENRYCMYRRTPESLVRFMPIPFQTHGVGTLDNFQYHLRGTAQIGEIMLKRPLEMLYYDFAN